MIWFKHDSNAATDAKVKKLIIRYGAEGYAIYFHCIELIVSDISENNITFELEHDSEIIADDLKIKGTAEQSGQDRVNEIMRYLVALELFEENRGKIYCYKILKRLDSSMTSNVKMRKLIVDGRKSHDQVMISHDDVMQEENRRERKEEIDKKEEIDIELQKPKKQTIQKIPTLYKIIESIFLSKNNENFDNYKKEGMAIKGLITKAEKRENTDTFIQELIEKFYDLTINGNTFWTEQPFLPSALNASGIFARVEKQIQVEEFIPTEPDYENMETGEIIF